MDLNNYFQKYKTNKLIGAINYQINIMDETDEKIIKMVRLLNKQLNLKYRSNFDISFISMIMRLIYNSYSVVSFLPHMLDKTMNGGKPCLHIFMSESIAQLVSISLSSECYNILDEYLKNTDNSIKDQLEIKNIFLKIFSEIPNLEIDNLLNNSNKNLLQDHCNDIKYRIIRNTERLCNEYYKYMNNININNKCIINQIVN